MATIIKSHAAQQPSGVTIRGLAYSLSDISGQADAYVADVRNETNKIVATAQAEADAIRKKAEQTGRRAAEQTALKSLDEKVAAQMQSVLPALESAVAQLADAKHDWQRHWEAQAVGLACAMAQRIVRSELSRRPEITLEWVREALQLAAGSAELTVQLAPSDFGTLQGQVDRLVSVFAPAATARIVADDSVSPGGCRIVSEFGVIDQQIETQLARLEEELS
ncbi:MAG: hypothetical protein CMJ58_24155 [Planctomycetaceae bacterium]|nr:hypothetical protein [Planctomycetaceae bacterium]